jgi:hypothetical protein
MLSNSRDGNFLQNNAFLVYDEFNGSHLQDNSTTFPHKQPK